jgi:hypothetical protein
MCHVMICRHRGSGETEAGIFLVDTYCVGVKSAFYQKFSRGALDELREKVFREQENETMAPACARKFVEDAVAYARGLGLPPDPDYKHAARVLGGLDAGQCDTVFTFGKDGKPLFVQGPNDTGAFIQRVVTALRLSRGEGNFNLMLEHPLGDEWKAESMDPKDE